MAAELIDDKVWWNAQRKLKGICAEVAALRADGLNVLLLAHFEGTLSVFEMELRARTIAYERFSTVDLSWLCSGVIEGTGKLWLGLARALQTSAAALGHSAASVRLEIIVAEHHPLHSRDVRLVQAAAAIPCPTQLGFHVSLDEPLMVHFRVDSIRQLLKQLGGEEDTHLSNPLITTAIRRAQEKIESRVPKDLPAHSCADWFKYNLPGKG